MSTQDSHAGVLQLRLLNQRLHPATPFASFSPAALVAVLCGLQAQEPRSAQMALGARLPGMTMVEIERARVETRRFVRTWCQRGTLHLVAADDLAWLLPQLGPAEIQRRARRYRQLGIDGETGRRAVAAIPELLSRLGPLTRPELAQRLEQLGHPVAGQAIAHLVSRAALEGRICFGPDRDGEPTYVTLSDWVQVDFFQLPEAEFLPRLARRYLAAHGPAGTDDFASWAGLNRTQARTAFAALSNNLIELPYEDRSLYRLSDDPAANLPAPIPDDPQLHLLPAYDPFILDYRQRGLVLPPEFASRIFPGGGLFRPAVTLNGQAIAAWRLRPRTTRIDIEIEPFTPLAPDRKPLLHAEAERLAHFFETETRVVIQV